MERTTALVSEVPCWTSTLAPTRRSRSASQHTVAVTSRSGAGGASVAARMSPRETSTSLSSRITTDCPAPATSSGPSGVSIPAITACDPRGSTTTSSPTRDPAGLDLARVPAVVAVDLGGACGPRRGAGELRSDDMLHREAELRSERERGVVDALQVAEHGRAVVPRRTRGAGHHVVALGRRHRDAVGVRDAEAAGQQGEVGRDPPEVVLGVVDQVDLVHHQHHVRDPQQRGDRQVAAGLLDHALARVDQQHDHIGGRRTGDGVPGVLHVPRAVGQDELPGWGREVAVRHVDRDALFALGAQPVGEQRQVRPVQALALADLLDVVEGVAEHRVGVEQQPTDQGGLAVVDRSGRGQPQQGPPAGRGLGGDHQK